MRRMVEKKEAIPVELFEISKQAGCCNHKTMHVRNGVLPTSPSAGILMY